LGETVTLFTKEKTALAKVCEPVFIDPDGLKMRD
jgi:hypothetical protein